jgi:hypothetical protein
MRAASFEKIQAIKASRREISAEFTGLVAELDVQRKVRDSVRTHPLQWLGSAGLLGVAASAFLRRASVPKPAASSGSRALKLAGEATALSKFGWLAGLVPLAKLVYPVLRPVLIEFATKTVQGAVAKKGAPK